MNTYKVPIKNVLYMYSYIWDRKRTEDFVNLDAKDDFAFSDMMAELFLMQTRKVLFKGLSKEYVSRDEEIPAVRGRIDYKNTVFKQSLNKGKVICDYDEYDENTLINQIIKSTAFRLYRCQEVSNVYKKQLRTVISKLSGVDYITVDRKSFREIKLNRNTDYYFILLKVCELIINSSMFDTNNGEYHFFNIFDDDEQLHHVFELFVYKFYSQKLPSGYKVNFQKQLRFNVDADEDLMLPVMRMDTTVETHDKFFIIDTKYYKEYLQKGLNGEKLISGNIYQMLSYLNNINTDKDKLEGVLLYPKPYNLENIDKEYKISVTSNGLVKLAKLRFITIDLEKGWKDIEQDLLGIVIKK